MREDNTEKILLTPKDAMTANVCLVVARYSSQQILAILSVNEELAFTMLEDSCHNANFQPFSKA